MTTLLQRADAMQAALDALARTDPDVAAALERLGQPDARQREPGFATFLHIILAQQVSVASAAAVWRRLDRALGSEPTPARILALGEEGLRALGFSRQKAGYACGLAEAVLAGRFAIETLPMLDEEAAVAAITGLRGFGRWSAEIYLLFALGRVDVFPADDLAVQLAWQRLKRLDFRPTARQLRQLAEPWRPYRGAGAILLWHCYMAAPLDAVKSPPQ